MCNTRKREEICCSSAIGPPQYASDDPKIDSMTLENHDPSVSGRSDLLPKESTKERSIKVTRKTTRSYFMFTAQHLIKPFKNSTTEIATTHTGGSEKLIAPKKGTKNVQVQEQMIEGICLYTLQPKKSPCGEKRRRLSKRRLYYFAGGGWQNPPSIDHWRMTSEIAIQVPDISVHLVSYPLAPQSPAPEAFPRLLKLYRSLLLEAQEAGEGVILAGDSAGGNVVLAVTLAALADDPKAPCPTSILAISPSTDLRRQNPDMLKVEKHDPILSLRFVKGTADAWRGDWDASDPRLSPLFANVDILANRGVHVHGVTGTYDILAPDATLFREKCNDAGVQGEWLEWEKQFHCFPLAFTYKVPESVQGKDWILDLLTRCP
ncbi:alpha/beta-hydrolase [Acrodontium crateriforme]|uniref:Alpha/beta-hydrolase n=1 Tax=Acrodontium crateriforme TaxID=150365 RepID=A0AAQ3M9U6_9PEZI|nr:alpha/beta-hydrolase [Acrodontium crateriforme]